MSPDNQSDQSYVIGEMFDAANVSQPSIQRGFTVNNINQPSQMPQSLETENNGFTSDNMQQPAPQTQGEESDE